ncbi:MAG: heavy metal-responsive transcriptional regulator [Planctomycetes bacterium]|nr:heavy metal-responsive transcriptional regulator [Planctomycetota bacterium]
MTLDQGTDRKVTGMTIGQLAKRCGVNVETIRYYERRGLLRDPRRRGVGYRDYDEDDERRLRFIKQAQGLGFTLKEISELLDLRVARSTTCADVRAKAEAKVNDIEEKVQALETFKGALLRLVSRCSGAGPTSDCPILEAIEAETEEAASNPTSKAPRKKRNSS